MTYLLGIDGGLATFGAARYRVERGELHLAEVATFRTAKSAKKRTVLASDDNVRRCRELVRAIKAFCEPAPPAAICAEAMSFPRSASVAAKMAMAWGAVAALAEAWRCPIVQASPQQIKTALCGNAKASKEDVQAAVELRFPGVAWPRKAADVEHAADAAAAVLACCESDVVRTVLLMAARDEG